MKFENNCPPLEIGISPYSGDVINITCFITSDDFRHINLNFSVVSDKSIQVDTRIFSKANDFNDNDGTVKFFWRAKIYFVYLVMVHAIVKLWLKVRLAL